MNDFVWKLFTKEFFILFFIFLSSGASRWWNESISVDENSPIVLLEADTLRKVGHFVELDHHFDDEGQNEYELIFFVYCFRQTIPYVLTRILALC